ncbi:type II toxin-antitoxin system ParD family antitoxin [Xanthobacter sp. TB0139]|uniref:type II toxin-antitoxin system ParD family antitoxin n=1 Tax=Xanthobacter sp. TB0139 TaxID=3459178 RepID=UPI004039542D
MSNETTSHQTALLPEQQSLVESFITSGRYEGPHAVITAALKLLREKERERTARLSALHAALAAETPKADTFRAVNAMHGLEEASSEIERLLASANLAASSAASAN